MKRLLVVLVCLSSVMVGGDHSLTAAVNPTTKPAVITGLVSMPLAFTENQGQWDERVLFRANAGGTTMWLTENGVYYQFTRLIRRKVPSQDDLTRYARRCRLQSGPHAHVPDSIEHLLFRASLISANLHPQVVGDAMLEHKCNYYLGDDPNKWRAGVLNHRSIHYKDIYSGIDLKYYGNGAQMEYDFIISPGADPSQIQVRYEGVECLSVNEAGELIVQNKWGAVTEQRPVVYQIKGDSQMTLWGEYTLLTGNSFSIKVSDSYDPRLPLIIDPVLTYSTYFGGSNDDYWNVRSCVDSDGNTCLSGLTFSTDLPTKDPFQGTIAGASDIFVTKLNAAGDALLYSTYLGGSSYEYGADIACDLQGNAYITGETESSDFPTANAFDDSLGGDYDAFVTKLSPSGALAYSTYLGGSGLDEGLGITVDTLGCAFVTGDTDSEDFPTENPFQESLGWGTYAVNAFVTKLNESGSQLIYSTYLGGSNDWDVGWGIAVDAAGCAYVTGEADESYDDDFPTQNPLQGNFAGGDSLGGDAFITKFNEAGDGLAYSTYLGGSQHDFAFSIAVDESGNALVTGRTSSGNFPTANPIQVTHAGGSPAYYEDAYVVKVNSAGTALVYGTYLGGDSDDGGTEIVVDGDGNAYVAGWTGSENFPTADPIQGTYAGGQTDPETGYEYGDAFIARIDAAGNTLTYSTYLGGSQGDVAGGIDLDANGVAHIGGFTGSDDFPTVDPLYPQYMGGLYYGFDAFVAKISEVVNLWHVSTKGSDETGDGSAENPFATIQHGIDMSSSGDTVLAAEGTYYERINFDGKAIVVTSEYAIDSNSSHVANTIIDGETSIVGVHDTASVVVFCSGEDTNSVLLGFTIRGGAGTLNTPYAERRCGGGVFCDQSSPTISKCIIRDNVIDWDGGGVFCYENSSPSISHCVIAQNESEYGGGIYCKLGSEPTVSKSLIIENTANTQGGAVCCWTGSIDMNNCTIVGNTSFSSGGGIYTYDNNSQVIKNSILWNNAPDQISSGFGGTVEYCDVQGSWPGTGNLDCDPEFCDTATNNYYLFQPSCCVGAGEGGVDIGAHGVGCDYSVTILRPRPEEPTFVDHEFVIEWDITGGIDSVTIELSRDSGDSWETIATGETGTSYAWMVTGDTTSEALIHIFDPTNPGYADTTDSHFPILPAEAFSPGPQFETEQLAKRGHQEEFFDLPKRDLEQGYADLVVLYENGLVDIYPGQASGGFDSVGVEVVNVDSGAVDLEVADMNEDGLLDLLVANAVTNVVSLHFANGDDTFTSNPDDTVSLDGSPIDIGVADFDRDGHLDLWIATQTLDELTVRLGNGDGSFSVSPISISLSSEPYAAATADFSGDNILDIATAHGSNGVISVYAGVGNGNFTPLDEVTTSAAASNLVAFDADADGVMDIGIAYSDTSAQFTTLLNDGSGNFSLVSYDTYFGSHSSVAVGDYTGDGTADIIITSFTGDSLVMLPSIPGGGLSYPYLVEVGDSPVDIVPGDFDFDGLADVLVLNAESHDSWILSGQINTGISTDLEVTTPNGGEEWLVGYEQQIEWLKGEGIVAVNVQLSRDSGASWQTIATNQPGDAFTWKVVEPISVVAQVGVFDPTAPTRADTSDNVFSILECCVGIRGNVDGGVADAVNVVDLIYLVDYLFFDGPPPPCMEEADVDGSGAINVADVTHLVDFLFFGGPAPAACP